MQPMQMEVVTGRVSALELPRILPSSNSFPLILLFAFNLLELPVTPPISQPGSMDPNVPCRVCMLLRLMVSNLKLVCRSVKAIVKNKRKEKVDKQSPLH